jgi:hypothetical protein
VYTFAITTFTYGNTKTAFGSAQEY